MSPLRSYSDRSTAEALAQERQRFGRMFFYVAPAMFLGALDQTIVAAALPAIAAALGNFIHITWVVTAYLLAATIAAPVYGRLGDAFGRRRAMIWALGFFVTGSLACTLALSFEMLVAARFVQGLGGGGLITLAQALIGEAVSPRERGRFQGWFSAVFALASTIGPFAGGVLSETLGWRSVFWANIPLGLLAAVVVVRITSLPGDQRFRFDIFGTFLVIASSVTLLTTLSLGVSIGWVNPLVAGLAGLSLLGYALLIPVEARSDDPLLPVDLLAKPVVWRCVFCVLLFAAVLFSLIVQLPIFLQLVVGVGPAVSGLMLLPAVLAQVTAAMLAGTRISRTGQTGHLMGIGFGTAAVGFFTLASVLHLGLWAIALALIVTGLGLGMIGPLSQTLVQWAAGVPRVGRATGLISFSRSIGGLIGAALASMLLIVAFQYLAPNLTHEISDALTSSPHIMALPTASVDAARLAFRFVFAMLGVVSGLTAILAATIPDVDLGRKPEA